jgi:PAS domain S-box-containing protein
MKKRSNNARHKGMDVQETAAEYYIESKEHYRTIVNALRAAVISIDPQERVVLWNPKAEVIFGYMQEDVAGKSLEELVTTDGAGRDTLRNVLKSRPEQYLDMKLRRKDGAEFPADVLVFAAGGGWKQWTNLVIRDTTGRKQAEQALCASEEALRQSNERLEELVRERTAQLEDTVATLKNEVVVRRRIQTQLHQLSRKSLEALEADRRMVSRELHDSIGGSLAAIKFGLEYAAEQISRDAACSTTSLEPIISHLVDTIKETKRISVNLRPLTLDDLGLLATIESYARQFSQRYGHVRLVREIQAEEQEIPDEFKIVIYRVMQEALANAVKHSRADLLHIRLRREDAQIVFEVEDNGCGFSVNDVFSRNDGMSGFGLKSMQERTEICNGVFGIHSRPDGGTCIRVTLPVGGPAVVCT